MLGKPGQCFGGHPVHRNFGHQFGELVFESSNPAVGQDDVGIQDLTR